MLKTTPDWDKMGGLLPAIVQDAFDGRVLMLGYMNAEALQVTAETGKVTFWSRSRKALWTKGETSGNTLNFVEAALDFPDEEIDFIAESDVADRLDRIGGQGLAEHAGRNGCTRPDQGQVPRGRRAERPGACPSRGSGRGAPGAPAPAASVRAPPGSGPAWGRAAGRGPGGPRRPCGE